jgi:hypothetical protein
MGKKQYPVFTSNQTKRRKINRTSNNHQDDEVQEEAARYTKSYLSQCLKRELHNIYKARKRLFKENDTKQSLFTKVFIDQGGFKIHTIPDFQRDYCGKVHESKNQKDNRERDKHIRKNHEKIQPPLQV